jgi:integrase
MPRQSRSENVRTRTRIARGIYRDAYGLAATVKAGRLQREKRFPPDTSLKTLKAWQNETRVALRALAPTARRGTFAADARTYLAGVAAMDTFKEREQHIALWTAEFGPRVRYTIGTPEIDAVLSRWLTAGLAHSTVRNRRTALMHLWNRLDGPDAPNPVRRSLKPKDDEPEARGVSYDRIRAVLAALPDVGQGLRGRAREKGSKTAARLAVMAFTGLPQSLIKRLRPADIDWQAGTLYAPARRKGKGTRRKVLPLTADGLLALRRFAALECWGGFSNSSLWKTFQRACAAVGLTGIRPYDLRHSFATAMYALTGDAKATGELLMHNCRTTTDRYTEGAVSERLRLAVAGFDRMPAGSKTAGSDGWQAREKTKKTA